MNFAIHTVVLLCVLFYCTCVFGDDYHHTHHKARHNNKNYHNLKQHFFHKHYFAKHKHSIHNRDNNNTADNSTCSNSDIQILVDPSNDLIGFNNPRGIFSVIFNYSSSAIIVILNDQNRTIFGFNSTDSDPFKINNASLQNQSFSNLFTSVASQGINNLANNSQIVNRGLSLPVAYINTILNLSRFLTRIGSSLNRFNIQSQCFNGDLNDFPRIFRVVLDQFGPFPSGFEHFIRNSTNIDLFSILNSPNALERARQFISIFAPINDINPVLRTYLNNGENFFLFVRQFDLHMTTNNIDSFFEIISSVFSVYRRQGSNDSLFRALLHAPNERIGLNNSNLTNFLQTLNHLNSSINAQNWVNTIQNLTQNSLFVGNANITSFLNSLSNRSSDISSVNASIQDLASLSNLFNPVQLYTSYIRFIGNLMYNPGNFNLSRIYPGIDFQNPDILNRLSNLQNLTQLVSQTPSLNTFFNSLVTNINTANNLSLNIEHIFTPNYNPLNFFGSLFSTGMSLFEEFSGLGNQNNSSNIDTTSASTEESTETTITTENSLNNASSSSESEETTEATETTANEANNATTIIEETTPNNQSAENSSTTINENTEKRKHHLKKHHSGKILNHFQKKRKHHEKKNLKHANQRKHNHKQEIEHGKQQISHFSS